MPTTLYRKGYVLNWKTMNDEQLFSLYIHDTYSGIDPTSEYKEMKGATANPVTLGVIDNDESIHTTIRAKKCTIKYLSELNIPFSTFCSGANDRFLVEYFSGSNMIFKGYLVLNGNQCAFLPGRNVIVLVATDNLKLLDKTPLVKDDGTNPKRNYSLMQYLVWALAKTNLQLRFRVALSLMESGNGTLSHNSSFANVGSTVTVTNTQYARRFFRAGKRIIISDTASNNIETSITSVTIGVSLTFTVSDILTDESSVMATFTDKNPCLLSNIYVDARTFEDEVNLSEDCLAVIKKILGSVKCYIEQHNGEWWIIGVDEHRWDETTLFTFNSDGTIDNWQITSTNRVKEIGLKDSGYKIQVSDAATICTLYQRQKSVKEIYKYQFWKEIICNKDFERGDLIGTLPDETIDGITYNAFSYNLDCWVYEKNIPAVASDSPSYIKRLSYNGYEKERYLHMEKTVANDFYYWRCTELIPMELKDKFLIGLDFRHSTDLGGGSDHFELRQVWVRLYGNDGTYWNLHAMSGSGSSEPASYWKQTDGTWTTNQEFCNYEGESAGVDFTQYQNVLFESTPLPVSGFIEILLLNTQTPGSQTKDFTSLELTYLPFINGYQKVTSEYDKFTSPDNALETTEEELFISGGLRKLFKGAMKYFNGDDLTDENDFFLATEFYNYRDGRTGGFGYDRFGKYVANEIWNQVKSETSVFQCSLLGIDSTGDDPADLTHRYFIRHSFEQAIARTFMGVAMPQQEMREQKWELTLAEVYNSDNGYEYDSAKHEFKYE